MRQLAELRHCADDYRSAGDSLSADDFFSAEQNARLVANAEQNYRAMFHVRVASWNLRDTHMVETLEAVVGRLEHEQGAGCVAVWALVHIDETRALEPLERTAPWDAGEPPETFPSGL